MQGSRLGLLRHGYPLMMVKILATAVNLNCKPFKVIRVWKLIPNHKNVSPSSSKHLHLFASLHELVYIGWCNRKGNRARNETILKTFQSNVSQSTLPKVSKTSRKQRSRYWEEEPRRGTRKGEEEGPKDACGGSPGRKMDQDTIRTSVPSTHHLLRSISP